AAVPWIANKSTAPTLTTGIPAALPIDAATADLGVPLPRARPRIVAQPASAQAQGQKPAQQTALTPKPQAAKPAAKPTEKPGDTRCSRAAAAIDRMSGSNDLAAYRGSLGPTEPIPLTVLTGFLGAGKTSLLNRLIHDPALAGTAVIINEFGEIGLDHLL